MGHLQTASSKSAVTESLQRIANGVALPQDARFLLDHLRGWVNRLMDNAQGMPHNPRCDNEDRHVLSCVVLGMCSL
jgi:hypothetical protein